MKIIFSLLIFCLVLFLYLHIYFHLKTSDDLEIYEIEQPSKDKLEEICDLRQPVMFDFNNERLLDCCKQKNVLDEYGAFDVKIRNVKSEARHHCFRKHKHAQPSVGLAFFSNAVVFLFTMAGWLEVLTQRRKTNC